MSVRIPNQAGSFDTARTERRVPAEVAQDLPWALILSGAFVVWALLLVGLQQVAQHVWRMSLGEAWALAIGIMGYIAIFAALVVSLAVALMHERW